MEKKHIADRIQKLAVSATLAMSQKSSELKAADVDVVNLSVGEPDFPTPEHIKQAAKKRPSTTTIRIIHPCPAT